MLRVRMRAEVTLGDGFGPEGRVRDINPDGIDGADEQAAPQDEASGSAYPPIDAGALPMARGRRFVRSTSGDATIDSRTAAAIDAPSTPRPFDWEDPQQRGLAYEDPKRRRMKGKKAQREYEELIAARRREEAARAAEAANVEARGAAGFRDARRNTSLVTMSNPAYTPSAMYVASDPVAPERGKPWYKRLVLIIPVAVVLVAGLFAGIGLPAIAQARATAEANEAARVFTQALAEYRAAWTDDNLDALTAATPHLGIAESLSVLHQPREAQATLAEECTVFSEATRAANTLADNPPPSLVVLSSTSFSAAYRDAQAIDAQIATERAAGQTLLTALSATIPQLGTLCTNLQAGIAIENHASLRDEQELAPLRTVPEGGMMQFEERAVPCIDPQGCVNMADENARATYAASWRAIHEERALSLVAHYRDACWLEVLRPYCLLMSDAWDAAAGGVSSIASAMASEKPGRDPSQGDFPRLTQAYLEQELAFGEIADQATIEAGVIDPEVLIDQEPGWETRMLVRLTLAYETHLEVAVADYRAVGTT